MCSKKGKGLVHRHIQDICNAVPLILYLQCIPVIPKSLAGLARDIDIRKKMHFYLYDAISLAGLTPPSFNIETEPSWFVPSCSRFRKHGKEFTDMSKNPCISGGVGTWGSADWALINVDYFIYVVDALDRFHVTNF